METNLLDPLTFPDGEIDKFAMRHACYCGSHLVKYPAPGRLWMLKCPEHGPLLAYMVISKGKAAHIQQDITLAARELRPPEKVKIEQLMQELGL